MLVLHLLSASPVEGTPYLPLQELVLVTAALEECFYSLLLKGDGESTIYN